MTKILKKSIIITCVASVTLMLSSCTLFVPEPKETIPDSYPRTESEQIRKEPEETPPQTSVSISTEPETTALQTTETALQSDENNNIEEEAYIYALSLEEKICQMFAIMPDTFAEGSSASCADDISYMLERYPVGGLMFMGNNLVNARQTKDFIDGVQEISYRETGLPVFTFVDEEGGSVRRISGKFEGIPYIQSMEEISASGGDAYAAGAVIGNYLSELKFNADCAPVADVLSNPSNTVIGDRSFGSKPSDVADKAISFAAGLRSAGIMPVYKHFPGHGATEGDTHEGYAYTSETTEELGKCELIPFQAAIDAGAECIMVAHISLPNVTGDNVPASISPAIINGLLRSRMGFEGIVITDAMNMGAIANNFTAGEAAIRSIEAGADIILAPTDFYEAYKSVLGAVRSGRISESRIDESVDRILRVKEQINVK